MNPLPSKTKKSDISKHFMSPLQTINKDINIKCYDPEAMENAKKENSKVNK